MAHSDVQRRDFTPDSNDLSILARKFAFQPLEDEVRDYFHADARFLLVTLYSSNAGPKCITTRDVMSLRSAITSSDSGLLWVRTGDKTAVLRVFLWRCMSHRTDTGNQVGQFDGVVVFEEIIRQSAWWSTDHTLRQYEL